MLVIPFLEKEIIDKKTLKVASLFSGCGGLDLGFKQAGYSLKWANDNNWWACLTHKRNFGDHIVTGDIAEIDLKLIPDVDVITGGFPCQDFSVIWKRHGLDTQRGNSYRFLRDAIEIKQPKIFIGENVKGILSANQGKAIETIMCDFSKIGYNLTYKLLNFADYGVPQLRERVIIVGVRKDIDSIYFFPTATHKEETWITSGEALTNVENVKFNNEHQKIKEKTRTMLSMIPEGGNYTNIPKGSPYYINGMISHLYRRIDRNKPSYTIIAAGGGGTWGYHHTENRPLTNRERARLFGYPDDFIFEGSITEVRRQIGNSVPPPAAYLLAESLKPLLL